MVGTDRQRPGAESVISFSVGVDLLGVVVPDDPRLVLSRAADREPGYENSRFYTKITFGKLNSVAGAGIVKNLLKVVKRGYCVV